MFNIIYSVLFGHFINFIYLFIDNVNGKFADELLQTDQHCITTAFYGHYIGQPVSADISG